MSDLGITLGSSISSVHYQSIWRGYDYFLITLHRVENVDDRERLKKILTAFKRLSEIYEIPLIFPIHPRTRKMIDRFGFDSKLDCIDIIEPVGYLDFLILEKNARLILTDSGGVQEEACILNVPCGTLRDSTERPETLSVGSNMLVDVGQDNILEGIKRMMDKKRNWKNPFGDGKSGKKIIKIIKGLMEV